MNDMKEVFKERSIPWALYHEDFSDLTVKQIAEVFDTTPIYINQVMKRVYERTGHRVRYTRQVGNENVITEFSGV